MISTTDMTKRQQSTIFVQLLRRVLLAAGLHSSPPAANWQAHSHAVQGHETRQPFGQVDLEVTLFMAVRIALAMQIKGQ